MTIPQVVRRTMDALCHSINEKTSIIKSVYMYGSVALGDYIEGSSDIDFIAILHNPPEKLDIKAIECAHIKVENEILNADIMGAYLLEKDLGKPPSHITHLLTYYDRKLNDKGNGADINPITWWTLKNYGLRVYGAEVSMNYDLNMNTMIKYVIENLNTYWANWIDRIENQMSSINLKDLENMNQKIDEIVEWCALGMLRQLYTVKEHDIKSKVRAGYYGITIIPGEWHALIYEAINIKRLKPERYYTSNEKRLNDLLALLKYIQREANRECNKVY